MKWPHSDQAIEVYGLDNDRYRFNDLGTWHCVERVDVDIDRSQKCSRFS